MSATSFWKSFCKITLTGSDSFPGLFTRAGDPVFRLGYGTLTLAACQKNVSAKTACLLFRQAAGLGINWFDTAEIYGNYEQLARFLKEIQPESVFISTKAYAYDAIGLRRSLDLARRRLDTDVIDLFMLHEQESEKTLAGHSAAFLALLEAKEKGVVRYVGVSTHATSVAETLAAVKEGSHAADPDFDVALYRETDVLFALLSRTGIGLLDGTAEMMRDACRRAATAGITVLGMKLFGGGHLLGRREDAVADAIAQDYVSAWSVGMGSPAEIETNAAWFRGTAPRSEALAASAAIPRRLRISDDCTRCGRCVARCKSGAMSLGPVKAVSDPAKCTLCSYCGYVCRDFAIKVY